MIVDIFLKIAQNIPLSQSEIEELSAYVSASHITTAKITNMRELGELGYDLGEVWAGRFIASANPNNNDISSSTFTGTYMDASGVTGKNAGTTQFQLSSTDGKAAAGGGNVVLSGTGISILLGDAYYASRTYKFVDSGGNVACGVKAWGASGQDYIELFSVPLGALHRGTTAVSADADSGYVANASILAMNGGTIDATTPGVYISNDGTTKSIRITGALDTSGVIHSGTYTPTLTNTTNVAASTARVCQYMRVGSVVTVSGSVNIDPTATGSTVLTMSLPIASNFANTYELGGSGAPDITTPIPVVIRGSSTADAAIFVFNATSTAAQEVYFTFTYRII